MDPSLACFVKSFTLDLSTVTKLEELYGYSMSFQMPGLGSTSSHGAHFVVSSADNEFKSRTNDVFASLNSIETQHADRSHSADGHEFSRSRSPSEVDDRHTGGRITRRYQGDGDLRREVRSRNVDLSSFRRPSRRPPRTPYVPDFRRNPQNYTRYDLSSVADHTERSNTSAALSFLDDLRKRRADEEMMKREQQTDYENKPSETAIWGNSSKYVRRKHTFTRPNKTEESIDNPQPSTSSCNEQKDTEPNTEKNEKASFVGGKLTMPEYVVGQARLEKERKEYSGGGLSCDTLSLDHLNEVTVADGGASNLETRPEQSDSSAESDIKKTQFKKFKRKGCSRRRDSQDDE